MKKIKTRKLKLKVVIVDNTSKVPAERKIEQVVLPYSGKESILEALGCKSYTIGRAIFREKGIYFLYNKSQDNNKEPASIFNYGHNDDEIKGKVIFIGAISESGNPTSLKKDELLTLEEFKRPYHLRWEEHNLYQGIMARIEREHETLPK
jgi:hypothetical protein